MEINLKSKKLKALKEKKFYRLKNPNREFFCALCRSPRQTSYSRFLSLKQYLQLFLFWCASSYFLFPLMSYNVVYLFLIYLTLFEFWNKLLYRKELKCPYCGFDAVWYRRDVKVARQKVSEFWASEKSQQETVQENDVAMPLPSKEGPGILNQNNSLESNI